MISAGMVVLSLLAALSAPTAARPAPTPAFFESHRQKFLARLPAGSVAVLRAPAESPADARSDRHRQDSNFWYLTGFEEPNAVAVFLPYGTKAGRYILFVSPRDFATE